MTATLRNDRLLRNCFFVQTWAYAVSSLTSVVGTLVDGVIIGQFLGVEAISAFGIASPLSVAFSMAGAIISVGARTRYVRLIGGGNQREAQSVFSLSCLLSVVFAAVMMVLVLVFVTPLTRLLGATGNAAHLLPKARAYIIGIAVGLPVRNLQWVLWVFMPIDNDRRRLILKKGEDYILRIRDDCVNFDPVKRLALHSDTDPAHHIGLRMIINMAKEVDYIYILKLNNLLVKV